MAFPTTVGSGSNAWPATYSGSLGPYIYSGNVYVPGFTGTYAQVYKATDPSSSFSLADQATGGNAGINCISTAFTGRYIYFGMWATSTGLGFVSVFDCSIDAFIDVPGAPGNEVYTFYTTSPTSELGWIDISVRSDGDVIILHPGDGTANMGSAVDCVYYTRLEGTTWTAGVSVADTNTKAQEYQRGAIAMNASDQAHFGYTRDDTSFFYIRALSSANALRTERATSGAVVTQGYVKSGHLYTRSSTSYITFEVEYNTGDHIRNVYYQDFSDDTSPTINDSFAVNTNSLNSTHAFVCALDVDSIASDQKLYQGFVGSGDADIHITNDAGTQTWPSGSGTVIRASITGAGLSANIFSRGGNRVYAFIYNNGGTVYYDEFTLYSISAPSLIFNPNPLLPILVR